MNAKEFVKNNQSNILDEVENIEQGYLRQTEVNRAMELYARHKAIEFAEWTLKNVVHISPSGIYILRNLKTYDIEGLHEVFLTHIGA